MEVYKTGRKIDDVELDPDLNLEVYLQKIVEANLYLNLYDQARWKKSFFLTFLQFAHASPVCNN